MSFHAAFNLAVVSTLTALGVLALAATPALAANQTLKVTATGPGTVYGPGIECGHAGGPCETEAEEGTPVTLTAAPTERSIFKAWTGCESEPSPTECALTIGGAATKVTATFEELPEQNLKVSATGPGTVTGTSPGAEFTPIECGNGASICEATYNQAATVILFANHNERTAFAGWKGCPNVLGPTECEVTLTVATKVTAEFKAIPQQVLTVSNPGTGLGAGTITGGQGGEFTPIECGNGAETCTAEYNQGATIILIAAPNERSTFASWSGCESVSGTECTVTMSAAKSVEAKFTAIPQQKLTVTTEGAGVLTTSPGAEFTAIDCGNGATTCESEYNAGATIALTAISSSDNHLKEWEGACSGTGTCEVTMSAAKSVHAIFAPTFQTLTATPTGPGSLSAGSGAISDCDEGGGTCAGFYQEGSAVTLTASPAAHNHVTWTGCTPKPNENECEVTIGGGDTNVEASFQINVHTLTVDRTGLGSVSASAGQISECSPAGGVCAGPYPETSSVTLTATPHAHYHTEWGVGAGECNTQPSEDVCEVDIGVSNQTVAAAFRPNMHTLTVVPTGAGSVRASSGAIFRCSEAGGTCQGTYIEAASLTLTATPGPHEAVVWHGCNAVPSPDLCEVEIGASGSAVEVSFGPIIRGLTLHTAGTGAGRITCNGGPCASSYPEGTPLALTATPVSGSTFAGWSGAGCSGTAACQITLEADTQITASFTVNPPPLAEEECTVPQLPGSTLAQARSMLIAAHCTLGTVTKPKPKKHHRLGPLLVRSSSPAAGASLPLATKVNLTLGPKDKSHAKSKA